MDDTKQADVAIPMESIVKPRVGLYLCRRASEFGGKPCDEAFRVVLVNTDARNVDDPKKIPAHFGTDGDWYSKGTNHRVEGGIIRRDMGTKEAWAVEISDIQAFVDRYGPCVIDRDLDGFCTIMIYDDYIE